MLDAEGFRPNVGIIVANGEGGVLWARRVGQDAWQFPQGGIQDGEKPEDAVFRELYEEVGLRSAQVKVIGKTRGWHRYHLPKRFIRTNDERPCLGQKQKWFLLQLLGDESEIDLNCSHKPEFDHWQWASYWYPVNQIVDFKRSVYQRMLKELSPAHAQLLRASRRNRV